MVRLLIPLCVLLFASCTVITKDPNEKLPDDWPLPQLTLPMEIELKAGPAAVPLDKDKPNEKHWIVAWNKDDDWQAAIDHVESCLKPLNYYRSKEKGLSNPLGLDLPESRTYYSPDFLTEVSLAHGAYFDALGPRDIEFALEVIVYEGSSPKSESWDHMRKTRPGMVDELMDRAYEQIE